MRKGDLPLLSWARIHLVFLSSVSSSLFTSGAIVFRILIGGREFRYFDTISVCIVFVFCRVLSGVMGVWFGVMLVVNCLLWKIVSFMCLGGGVACAMLYSGWLGFMLFSRSCEDNSCR